MSEPLPWILDACLAYLGAGALFALPFLAVGVGRVDPAAARGTLGFRLAIAPGVVALWPLLAWRWWRGPGAPRETHRARARDPREVRP